MLTIKKVEADSIPVIQSLANAIWPVAYKSMISKEQISYMLKLMYSTDSLNRQIIELKHQFILAIENGTPIGFAAYSLKTPEEPSTYRLHKLYMLPTLHGKGFGKSLLGFIEADIRPAGAKKLELNVNQKNNAVHFYKKNGFEIIREEDLDIGNGFFMIDYIMEKKL